VPPAAAQRLAGHASIAVTLEVYTHLDAGDLDAAVDAALPRPSAPSPLLTESEAR
jgi:site-specific recombinase XerC